jgi:sortase A
MTQGVVGTGDSPTQTKVKLSWKRHFLPPFFGLLMMLSVLAFFNSQFIAVKIAALTYKPTTTQQAPTSTNETPPARDAHLTIAQAGVDAPIIYGVNGIDESGFQQALQHGVVHYPGTALPGQTGNTVIFGHSSGQVWAPGDYKFVFARLEDLQTNNKIELEYKGVRYVYRVTGKKVVPPTDVSVLQPIEGNNILTLITCTPVGTNKNRLIITAEQIVPNPSIVQKNESNGRPITEVEALPSSSNSSFWESLGSRF